MFFKSTSFIIFTDNLNFKNKFLITKQKQMKKRVPVSTIMAHSVITANVKDSLRHINSLLRKHNIRHVPVVSGDKLVGIISKSDIMRLSFGDIFDGQDNADETMFDMLKLEQVMITNLTTVDENDSIKEVAEKFTNVKFHALPVVRDEKLVGIVSTTDLIRYLLEQYE
jgi:CBS domain-containing protein